MRELDALRARGAADLARLRVLAVLDVDSDDLDAFDELDQHELESLCGWLAERFPDGEATIR